MFHKEFECMDLSESFNTEHLSGYQGGNVGDIYGLKVYKEGKLKNQYVVGDILL